MFMCTCMCVNASLKARFSCGYTLACEHVLLRVQCVCAIRSCRVPAGVGRRRRTRQSRRQRSTWPCWPPWASWGCRSTCCWRWRRICGGRGAGAGAVKGRSQARRGDRTRGHVTKAGRSQGAGSGRGAHVLTKAGVPRRRVRKTRYKCVCFPLVTTLSLFNSLCQT